MFCRNDWGALILVDERFSKSERYTRGVPTLVLFLFDDLWQYPGLSRWVRQGIKHYSDFASAQISLKRFAEDRLRTTSVNVTTSPPNFMYGTLSPYRNF